MLRQSLDGAVSSGKVGGLVFQKNGRVRVFRMPTVTHTTLQNTARAAFTTAAQTYAVLDPIIQDGWSTWAGANPRVNRVGVTYSLSAKQAYISLNAPRYQVGLPALVEAPPLGQMIIIPVGADLVSVGILSSNASVITVTFTGVAAPITGKAAAVYLGAPRSAVSRVARGIPSMRFIGTGVGVASPGLLELVLPNTFGNALEAQQYDWLVKIYDTTDFTTRSYRGTSVVA